MSARRRATFSRPSATAVFLVSVALTGLSPTPTSSAGAATSVLTKAAFLDLAYAAAGERFDATYHLGGELNAFGARGTLTLDQVPYATNKQQPYNRYGYSPVDQDLAYLFHESNGALVQWIQHGSNAAWCAKWPGVDGDRLRCSSWHPFMPTNGFATEQTPVVPTTALELLGDFDSAASGTSVVKRATSNSFGSLWCLDDVSRTQSLRACIDAHGFLTSFRMSRGRRESTATLEALGYTPSVKAFVTLIAPSSHVPLPPT